MRFMNPENNQAEWDRAWVALALRVGAKNPSELGAWQYMGTDSQGHEFRLRAGEWPTDQLPDCTSRSNRWEYVVAAGL